MHPLWSFLVRNYIAFLFLVLEGLALTLFITHSYYQKAVFVKATNDFTGSVFSINNDLVQFFSLVKVNKQLAEENAFLREKIGNSYLKSNRNEFIYKDTLYRKQYTYTPAKVINNTTHRPENYLTLNKGAKQNIKEGMAVICPVGVVGIVNEVSDNFSTVMSLLHPKCRISSKILKNNYVGTIIWDGNSVNKGKLLDIPTHVKIKIGDTIVTSGYSMVFPEGILIGTIGSFEMNHGRAFYNIEVNFSTDFGNIGYAYVVTNLFRDEMINLEKESRE